MTSGGVDTAVRAYGDRSCLTTCGFEGGGVGQVAGLRPTVVVGRIVDRYDTGLNTRRHSVLCQDVSKHVAKGGGGETRQPKVFCGD